MMHSTLCTSLRSLCRLAAATCLLSLSGCVFAEASSIGIARTALIPDDVTELAVTVISPVERGAMSCDGGVVRFSNGGPTVRATPDLFSEEVSLRAGLIGPRRVQRGSAEGERIDNVPVGATFVFIEGYDEAAQSVARACAGPEEVVTGRTATFEVAFDSQGPIN